MAGGVSDDAPNTSDPARGAGVLTDPDDPVVEILLAYTCAVHVAKQDAFRSDSFGDIYDAILTNRPSTTGGTSLVSKWPEFEIHRLMLFDDEVGAINKDSSLQAAYARGDRGQIASTSSSRTLDRTSATGIPMRLAVPQLDLRGGDRPFSVHLLRRRCLSVSGYSGVPVLYLFHDLLDHVWLFEKIRAAGLVDKYSDMIDSIGSPWSGDILSRHGELFSAIGFASRRFLHNGRSLMKYLPDFKTVCARLERASLLDERLAEAMAFFERDPMLRQWSIFSLLDATSQLVEERRRWGATKILDSIQVGAPDHVPTVFPLHSTSYIAFFFETVRLLALELPAFLEAQRQTNYRVEAALADLVDGHSEGMQVHMDEMHPLPKLDALTKRVLDREPGFSTAYFLP